MTRKRILAYRLQGSVAQRMFESNPESAEASEVTNPKEGLGVIISVAADEIKQTTDAIRATKQLIRDNDLTELLVYRQNLADALELVCDLFTELAALSTVAAAQEEDEDEDQ